MSHKPTHSLKFGSYVSVIPHNYKKQISDYMNKQEIIKMLELNHSNFLKYLNGLSEQDFEYAPTDKWSAGQQMQHIVLSVKPLVIIFLFPKWMIKLIFGVSNRKCRTYDELVSRYNEKLQQGGIAPGRFVPKIVQPDKREVVGKNLQNLVSKLIKHLNKFSEEDLNKLILPHPLLGKITIREMLFFTAYHVLHHKRITERNLQSKK